MGGQGKSQIALEYCHRKKNTPYSAVFWADATTQESVQRSFQAISEQIKKPADVLSDIQARVALVRRMFSSWSVQWLLIFDNYDNPNAFPNIADYIPQSELGAILVTSRHANSDTLVLDQSDHFIKLHGLEEDAALLLLTQRSQTKEFDTEDAKEIVKRLACHPLAITQAGAYIKKRGLPLCKFMKEYRKQRKATLTNTPPLSQYRKKLGNVEQETSFNVFTTWKLSFQQLQSESSANDVEAKLLTLFAFFDNADISEELFAEFNANSERVSESAKLLTWLNAFTKGTGRQWDSDSSVEVLITLCDLSLLQGFAQGPDGFYHSSLHPLIRDWIRLRTKEPLSPENRFIAATLVREMLVNCCYKEQFELPLFAKQNILAHIIALEDSYEELSISLAEILLNQKFCNECTTSHSWSASFLSSVGSYHLAEILHQRVNEQNKTILGIEHPDTLTSMANLALTYQNQRRWKKAEELEVQVMETRKRVLGLEHPSTLTSIANLASTYRNQGRWKEAEELEVQVMETRKRVLGLEHPNTLTSIANLASTYRNQGRWKEAGGRRPRRWRYCWSGQDNSHCSI